MFYDQLRQIDHAHRGTGAFNWFETPGLGGYPANLFNHTIRMWKFRPRHARVDLGWTNKYLVHGRYQGPVTGGEDLDKEPIGDDDAPMAPTGS